MAEVTFTGDVSGASKTITIYSAKVDDDWTNDIKIIMIPTTTHSSGRTTYLYNLMRAKQVWTVTGHITHDGTNSDDTIRGWLRTMRNENDTVTMNYKATNYTVAILKMTITEEAQYGF